MTETPTPPADANGCQPNERRSNLGTKALIVAVCAFMLAFVPFLILAVLGVKGVDLLAVSSMVAPYVALVAIVMAIISLFIKGSRRAGAAGIALGIAAGLLGVKMMAWSHEAAKKSICTTNLRCLGQTVNFYISRNEGVPPPNLHTLIQAKLFAPDGLRCPSVRDSDGPSDYFYLPPGKETDGRTIIACDFEGNHAHGRHILHYDSSTTWMGPKDFAAELAKPQNAAFAKALAEAVLVGFRRETQMHKVDIVGVYPVRGPEPCHLIELVIHDSEGEINIADFTQEVAGEPRDNWQVPYMENILNSDGTAILADDVTISQKPELWRGDVRLVFFFHYLDPQQPLKTPFGEMPVPQPTSRPDRLKIVQYEPVD